MTRLGSRASPLKLKMNDEKILIVTVDRADEATRLINEMKNSASRG
jgi:hypothetical protein